MSVQEMIAKLPELEDEEFQTLKEVMDQMAAERAEKAEAERQAAVWRSLLWGFGTSGGKTLSEGIDEALYGTPE